MSRRLLAAALVAACSALPAPAAIAAPAPQPAPVAEPVPGLLATRITDAHRLGGRPYLVAGERLRLRGITRPYVDGQRVVVRVHRGARPVLERVVRVRRLGDGTDGHYRLSLRAPRGRIAVRATLPAHAGIARSRAPVRKVRVLSAAVAPGSRSVLVRLLQRGLAGLRYAVPRTGVLDPGTQRAIIAFRKVNGMARTPAVSRKVVARVLARRGGFEVRHPRAGRHVEADISRQVMALVDGSRVHRVYHVSSGAPATPTILGTFRVYRKQPGTNSLGMVHSSYFIHGYAIHGYASVPVYNASHGCLRVPLPDARHVYDWVRMGDRVIVYP